MACIPVVFSRSFSTMAFILTLFLITSAAHADNPAPGVSANEIVIGQSVALTGQLMELGQRFREGAQACFNYVNNTGGINGRRIKLITYDDGYDARKSVDNTSKLIKEDKAFLLFGYMGTPTSKAAAPLAVQNDVPFLAPYSGAEFLRNPPTRQVFNVRASYHQETEAMVKKLVDEAGFSRISVFYQNDAFGKDGLEGVRRALTARGIEILNEASYASRTLDVEGAVEKLLVTKPEAVVMIGVADPGAKFIRLMRDAGSNSLFVTISAANADALGKILANKGVGVVTTQVVPYPYDTRIPVVADFNRQLQELDPGADPGFVNMEGYLGARALCRLLADIPEPLTRDAFIAAAEQAVTLDLGGFTIGFNPADHQGSDLVYFVQIGPGGFISPVENLNQLYKYER